VHTTFKFYRLCKPANEKNIDGIDALSRMKKRELSQAISPDAYKIQQSMNADFVVEHPIQQVYSSFTYTYTGP